MTKTAFCSPLLNDLTPMSSHLKGFNLFFITQLSCLTKTFYSDSTLSVMQMLGLDVVFFLGPFLLYYFQKEIILIYLDLFKNNIKCHTISK